MSSQPERKDSPMQNESPEPNKGSESPENNKEKGHELLLNDFDSSFCGLEFPNFESEIEEWLEQEKNGILSAQREEKEPSTLECTHGDSPGHQKWGNCSPSRFLSQNDQVANSSCHWTHSGSEDSFPSKTKEPHVLEEPKLLQKRLSCSMVITNCSEDMDLKIEGEAWNSDSTETNPRSSKSSRKGTACEKRLKEENELIRIPVYSRPKRAATLKKQSTYGPNPKRTRDFYECH
jgi:hypothetical protein